MSKIKAIVFDSDGTLLDTRELILAGYERTLQANGLSHKADREFIRSHLGKPVFETYKSILGNGNHFQAHELTQQHEEIQDQLIDTIKSYLDLPELINFLHRFELFVCLNSSGTTRQVWRNFRSIGLTPSKMFDLIITADNGLPRKPDPETIHYISTVLAIKPEEIIMIGDHSYDIQLGKTAGVYKTIAVTHGFGSLEELQKSGADEIVESLSQIKDYLKELLLKEID